MGEREDLMMAEALGYLLVGIHGWSHRASARAGVLRYDTSLPPGRRAALVCAAIRQDPERPKMNPVDKMG